MCLQHNRQQEPWGLKRNLNQLTVNTDGRENKRFFSEAGSNKVPVKSVAGTNALSQFRLCIVQRTWPMWCAKAVAFSGLGKQECDVIGQQMQPRKDAAPELGHGISFTLINVVQRGKNGGFHTNNSKSF